MDVSKTVSMARGAKIQVRENVAKAVKLERDQWGQSYYVSPLLLRLFQMEANKNLRLRQLVEANAKDTWETFRIYENANLDRGLGVGDLTLSDGTRIRSVHKHTNHEHDPVPHGKGRKSHNRKDSFVTPVSLLGLTNDDPVSLELGTREKREAVYAEADAEETLYLPLTQPTNDDPVSLELGTRQKREVVYAEADAEETLYLPLTQPTNDDPVSLELFNH